MLIIATYSSIVFGGVYCGFVCLFLFRFGWVFFFPEPRQITIAVSLFIVVAWDRYCSYFGKIYIS